MKFTDLAWAALLSYYMSAGYRKYVKLFADTVFLSKLRERPQDMPDEEFAVKVIMGFISDIGMRPPDLMGEGILSRINELRPCISSLADADLLSCDLSSEQLLKDIRQIYETLSGVEGLWITGISKIAHVLNDRLFVAVNISTLSHFGLFAETEDFIKWSTIAQQNAREVNEDFLALGFHGTPGEFLSEKLGYVNHGCRKSLPRFIDEYFWLTIGENLPVPPKWLPPQF